MQGQKQTCQNLMSRPGLEGSLSFNLDGDKLDTTICSGSKGQFRQTLLISMCICLALLAGCSSLGGDWSIDDDTEDEITNDESSVSEEPGSEAGQKQISTEINPVVEQPVDPKAEPATPVITPEVKSEVKEDVKTTETDLNSKQQADQIISTPEKKPVIKSTPKTKTLTKKTKNPSQFLITVGDKDPKHPFYGKGYPRGFLVDGVPGNHIVMERGKTYTLEVETDPLHDVYLSQKEIGWGSSAWTQGIEGQFIYNGTITVKPANETPSSLYYACRNHPFMGGRIYVVDKGEKAVIQKNVAPSKALLKSAKKPKKISKAMVSQKLMFASMLVKSKTTGRVEKSSNKVAKKLQKESLAALENAKKALTSGNIKLAYTLAVKGVNGLKQVKKLVPSESRLGLLKDRHKELLHSIDNFEKSHKKSYKRIVKKKGKSAGVQYDVEKVNKHKADAAAALKGTDYAKANKSLEMAQRIITVAIKKMMDSQTVVYDLNFETAEEEYDYELRRFKGYEILIPIAVKMKRPSEGAQKLMKTYLEKGRKMRAAAIKKAKTKDFPTAIAMLLDATKEVRRALRMVGISQ